MGAIPVLRVDSWTDKEVPDYQIWSSPAEHVGVYFIQAEEALDGPVKIGYSFDIGKRFDDLQCAHYEELYIKLICSFETPMKHKVCSLEGWFHKLWKEQCIRGEWFDPDHLMKEWLKYPLIQGHLLQGFEFAPKHVAALSLKIKVEKDAARTEKNWWK